MDKQYKIQLTSGKACIVDQDTYNSYKSLVWSENSNGYAYRNDYRSGKAKKQYLHRLVIDTPAGYDTDHINRNKLDNRRSNLRVATRSQNNLNRGEPTNNTSGYKGVSWYTPGKKWRATIRLNGRQKSLGYYFNIEDAVEARKNAEVNL